LPAAFPLPELPEDVGVPVAEGDDDAFGLSDEHADKIAANAITAQHIIAHFLLLFIDVAS